MYEIGYVVLNYNTEDVTKLAIEYIKKIKQRNYKIVLIDNASVDGSGYKLKSYFSQDENILYIQNEKNIGFANGNNIGYQLLRNKCEFICILNNDVLIKDILFLKKLQKSFIINVFFLLGPKILSPTGQVYPLMPKIQDIKTEKRKLFRKMVNLYLAYIGLNSFREKYLNKGNAQQVIKLSSDNLHTDTILHGCCLVFSSLYQSRYAEAFDHRTFLYGEENLLYLKLHKDGCSSVYNPELVVTHLEAQSTNTISKYKRTVLGWKHTVYAQKLLVSELEGKK